MMNFGSVTPRLPVRDVARTLRFYEDVLGFDVEVAWPASGPTFAILRRERVRLGFLERTGERAMSIGYAELYIEVRDAGAVLDEVERKVSIEWGPEVYSYGRREFAFRDPDRYLIIITEPTDEEPSTPEPSG